MHAFPFHSLMATIIIVIIIQAKINKTRQYYISENKQKQGAKTKAIIIIVIKQREK